MKPIERLDLPERVTISSCRIWQLGSVMASDTDRQAWGQIDRLRDRGAGVRTMVEALHTAYDRDAVRFHAETLGTFLLPGPSRGRTLLERLQRDGI
jgi:hypothetical protein